MMKGDRDEGEERLVVCFCLFVVNARFSSLSKVKGLKAFFFLIDDKCNVFFFFYLSWRLPMVLSFTKSNEKRKFNNSRL